MFMESDSKGILAGKTGFLNHYKNNGYFRIIPFILTISCIAECNSLEKTLVFCAHVMGLYDRIVD